jgi:hypothetical protein
MVLKGLQHELPWYLGRVFVKQPAGGSRRLFEHDPVEIDVPQKG